jgi:hypothetical protein
MLSSDSPIGTHAVPDAAILSLIVTERCVAAHTVRVRKAIAAGGAAAHTRGMEPLIPGERRTPLQEPARSHQSDTAVERCTYGRLVALELARLRTGPVLGESADRAQLRTRIGRWGSRQRSDTPGKPSLDRTETLASCVERGGELCAILRNARDSELNSGCFSSDWCVQRPQVP